MRLRPRPPEGVSPFGAVLAGIFEGVVATLGSWFLSGHIHLLVAVISGLLNATLFGFFFYYALRGLNTRAIRRAGTTRR